MRTLSVNGKFLSQPTTGVQRYAAEIVRAWDFGLRDGWIDAMRYRIRIYSPKNIVHSPAYEHIEVVRCSTNGRIWEQIELPWRVRGTMLYSPYAAAPIIAPRHAVTIHDAGVAATPQQYSFGFRAFYHVVYRLLGRRCQPVFTVSEFSRRELERYFSVPSGKIRVVPQGCDYILKVPSDPNALKRFGLLKGRYILGVSSQSVIKNFEGLYKAWTLLGRTDIQLAIAGRSNPRLFGNRKNRIGADALMLGYINDSELRTLYENAALFAYPSFYEGFGLPPVEAMTCGCPVIVAKGSALAETCGNAAIYCDPENAADIAAKMTQVLNDPLLADTMRQRARLHAAQFTVKNAAARLWGEIVDYL